MNCGVGCVFFDEGGTIDISRVGNIPPFKAGSLVTITAELKSTDLGEDDVEREGELESLIVVGSRFLGEVKTHSSKLVNQYIAVEDNERFTAQLLGFDDDESATVTITVDSNKKSRFTEPQKAALNGLAIATGIGSGFLQIVSTVCMGIPTPQGQGCARIASLASGADAVLAGILAAAAQDPSDPNFTVIAQPVLQQLPSVTVEPGITQTVADAFNALLTNETQAIALGRAILTTIDRAQGAFDANNVFWENAQVQALSQYISQLADLIAARGPLLTNVQNALLNDGVNVSVDRDTVTDFQRNIRDNGLPASFVQTIRQAGADDATIENVRLRLIVGDASALTGSFPARLAEPGIINAIQTAAQALSAGLVSGSLDPTSDTGPSNSDGITNDNTPTYTGTAPAGSRVQIFARRIEDGTFSLVGEVVTDATGRWSITTQPLAGGNYRITANIIPPNGPGAPTALDNLTVVTAVTQPPPPTDTTPPILTNLQRFGFHAMPTRIALSFSEALDPARATDLRNYTLLDAGPDRRFGTTDDHSIALRSATYDTTTNTVTLAPVRRLKLANPYQVIVRGSGTAGVTDLAGNLLDGDNNGSAGGDFILVFRRFGPSPDSTQVALDAARRAHRSAGRRVVPSGALASNLHQGHSVTGSLLAASRRAVDTAASSSGGRRRQTFRVTSR
jgi:hypothetical protein